MTHILLDPSNSQLAKIVIIHIEENASYIILQIQVH